MTAAVLMGALAAWGLALVVTGLVPARVSLGHALERLDAPAAVAEGRSTPGWVRLLGVPLVDTRFGQAWTRPAGRDLRVIGRSAAEHLARTVALVAVALLWAPATFGLMALGGVDVTWVVAVVGVDRPRRRGTRGAGTRGARRGRRATSLVSSRTRLLPRSRRSAARRRCRCRLGARGQCCCR